MRERAQARPSPPTDRVKRLQTQRARRNRQAILALALAIGLVVLGLLSATSGPVRRSTRATTPAGHAVPVTEPAVPHTSAKPVSIAQENARPGTPAWRIPPPLAHGIEGYADHVSAQRGDDVELYASTAAATFTVEAYRMGWYQGLGGRFVWRSDPVHGGTQTKPTFASATRTVSTKWRPSLELHIPDDWTPGDYLLKLVTDNGQSYVPLTVRDDSSDAPVIVMNAVTTWQAYNDWGGYSLYHGPRGDGNTRSKIVSFDRPYAGDGSADFIANELGLVSLVEHMGLEVTYTTGVDVHAHPELLTNHKVLVSLGHDEYWSLAMRDGVETARDEGVNLMFLGANAVFRRIRLQPSPLGQNRLEVNYRSARDDPMRGKSPAEVTTSWREPPAARPESTLTGVLYECNPVNVDGVVAESSSWVFEGTGVHDGDHVPKLIGTEYDRVTPSAPTPHDIEVLFRSPLRCRGMASYADAAYYTTPSGAGVFATGTGAWVCKLFSGCPADRPFQPDPIIQRITENILRVFAAGPAGPTHPSTSNLSKLRVGSSTPRSPTRRSPTRSTRASVSSSSSSPPATVSGTEASTTVPSTPPTPAGGESR